MQLYGSLPARKYDIKSNGSQDEYKYQPEGRPLFSSLPSKQTLEERKSYKDKNKS